MDDYIVRIKRREQSDNKEIVGLIEVVASQTQYHFHNFEELKNILEKTSGYLVETKILK